MEEWKKERKKRKNESPVGGENEKGLLGDFLGSVRGPTGRWNPRSRLIAIKAPLGPRL